MQPANQKPMHSRCKSNVHLLILCTLCSMTIATIFFTLSCVSTDDNELKLGILLSDIDREELLAGIEHELLNSGLSSETHVAAHNDSNTLLLNFKRQHTKGIDYFITSASSEELRPLCDYVHTILDAPVIWSFLSPPSNCGGVVNMLDAPTEALLTVLVERVFNTEVGKVIVVLDENHDSHRPFLVDSFARSDVEVVYIETLSQGKIPQSDRLTEMLHKYPHIPILVTSRDCLFNVVQIVSGVSLLQSRMTLALIDPLDRAKILLDAYERNIAERLMVFTATYSNVLKRRDVKEVNGNVDDNWSEKYSVARRAVTFLLDNTDLFSNSKGSIKKNLRNETSAIELLRFLPDQLRAYVVQDYPFFLEKIVQLNYSKEKLWTVMKEDHSTFKIFTKVELLEIADREDCQPTEINITSTENYRFTKVTVFYEASKIPPVILIPNSNPNGFTIKMQCGNAIENELLEIGCLGAQQVDSSVQCLVTKNVARRRRVVRSYTSKHIVPDVIAEDHDSERDMSRENRDDRYEMRQKTEDNKNDYVKKQKPGDRIDDVTAIDNQQQDYNDLYGMNQGLDKQNNLYALNQRPADPNDIYAMNQIQRVREGKYKIKPRMENYNDIYATNQRQETHSNIYATNPKQETHNSIYATNSKLETHNSIYATNQVQETPNNIYATKPRQKSHKDNFATKYAPEDHNIVFDTKMLATMNQRHDDDAIMQKMKDLNDLYAMKQSHKGHAHLYTPANKRTDNLNNNYEASSTNYHSNYERDSMKQMKMNRMSSVLPTVAGCVGASGGCSLCFIYLQFIVADANPGVCYGACAVGIGGACMSFVAIGAQRSLELTVVCSELFQQGRIDLTSYMADAKFGSILSVNNPLALKGYQISAAPLVYLMRKSPGVSEIIYNSALPWIHHMEYEVKVRERDNTVGYILTKLGIPLFTFLGFCFQNSTTIITCLIAIMFFRATTR